MTVHKPAYNVNQPERAKALLAFRNTLPPVDSELRFEDDGPPLTLDGLVVIVPRGNSRLDAKGKRLPFLDYSDHDPAPVPTRDDLLRHARRHGWEGVREVAAKYGIDLSKEAPAKTKKPKPARQRRTSAELREQVLDLHRRGLIQAAIADNLNVGDQRVKEILRETSGAV